MDPTEENAVTNVSELEMEASETPNAAAEAIPDTSDNAANFGDSVSTTESAFDSSADVVADAGLVGDIWGSAQTLLDLGGPVVAILIAMSIFGFAIALFKFFQFSTLSTGRYKQMHQAIDSWLAGDKNASAEQLQKIQWPLARTVQFGLDNLDASNEEQLGEELSRQANNFLNPYSKFLRPLELIYYLAPVLGLLGTVLGMIEAFKGLEASSGLDKDSTALAGGIWEALLTTAVGLSIAIPFTLIHAWLETRLDNITQMTSDLLTRVLTLNVGAKKK